VKPVTRTLRFSTATHAGSLNSLAIQAQPAPGDKPSALPSERRGNANTVWIFHYPKRPRSRVSTMPPAAKTPADWHRISDRRVIALIRSSILIIESRGFQKRTNTKSHVSTSHWFFSFNSNSTKTDLPIARAKPRAVIKDPISARRFEEPKNALKVISWVVSSNVKR
jgi:hypothetical protein